MMGRLLCLIRLKFTSGRKKLKVGKAVYMGAPRDGIYYVFNVTQHCTDKERFRKEELMSEADRIALEVTSEFAKEKGLCLKIYNLLTFKARVKATLKRINETPVVVIGKYRIIGEHSSELLRSELESYFGREETSL
jgi:hypothetical protein